MMGFLLLLIPFCLAQTVFATADKPPYSTKVYIGNDIEISVYTPTMFRFRVSHLSGERFPSTYEVPFIMEKSTPWAAVPVAHRHDENFDYVNTEELQIRVARVDRAWTVWSARDGHKIYPSQGPICGMFRDGYTVFDAAAAFDQRTDYSRFEHWFYSPNTGRYVDTYLPDDLIFDQFFIYGPSYAKLFEQLKDLVGPEPLLPKKAYGFFQTQHLGCKGGQSQLMQVATEFRERHIPADTLIVDYEWGDGCPGGDEDDKNWGRLDWTEAYKTPLSPAEMVSKLHAMHFDLMLIQHSAPDFPHRTDSILRDKKREWTARVYDEKLWWEKLREKLDLGVDGIWQDTRKNDVTDSVIWKGLQDYFGPSRRVLFMGNRNMVEVDPWELQRDDRAPSNSLLASRRYPFRWTGDAHTTWSELQWHIDAITNTFGPMSGVDYITADAYAADWKQQARWNQFLAFATVARSHTMKPWDRGLAIESLANTMAFGDKREEVGTVRTSDAGNRTLEASSHRQRKATAEDSIRKNLQLRYRLLPYLYSEAFQQYRTGFPILRPMVLAFPDDPYCKFNRERYQYMFGDSFLVAPVWADLNSMDIYLPRGTDWIDYWSKQVYEGGHIVTYDTADSTKLPLFVRAGSVIPMRADSEWIDPSQPDDPLTLDVYPGKDPSAFTLYEDDGVTTLYQTGQFAATLLETRTSPGVSSAVVIGETRGDYDGKLQLRKLFLEVNLIPTPPRSVLLNGRNLARLADSTSLSSAKEGWIFDQTRNAIVVKFAKRANEQSTVQVLNNPVSNR